MFTKIQVKGLVQGVGFRPFIWKLAQSMGLKGWVLNDATGVKIALSIPDATHTAQQQLRVFLTAISENSPPLSKVDSVEKLPLTPKEIQSLQRANDFVIVTSEQGEMSTSVLADAATCSACLAELQDPNNRRYGYAFINCTHCGPRYSIIRNMPYDRQYTSMAEFPMCSHCLAEYQNPEDRRFHAQPNACPECGPLLQLFQKDETPSWRASSLSQTQIIEQTVQALSQGRIVAVKGIGGVHLVCDATHDAACQQLRQRKHRPCKPFAVMAKELSLISPYAEVSALSTAWLTAVQGPVVLMPKTEGQASHPLSHWVAPDQNRLGFMLPSNPIHHLLLAAWQQISQHGVLVFTSANLSGEPQIYQETAIQTDLPVLADVYLGHNREIVRRLEDSVVSILPQSTDYLVIRQARGFSPYRLSLPQGFDSTIQAIAAGADLKNSVAIRKGSEVVLSQYLGDLSRFTVQEAYQQTWQDLTDLYHFTPNVFVHDAHPSYYSTQFVQQKNAQTEYEQTALQHHHAHFNACLLENQVPLDETNYLGVILDGLGYGLDNTLWGGEFLYGNYLSVQRVAHLNATPLLGGDKANQEPWRNAFSQLQRVDSWANLVTQYAELACIQKLQKKPIQLLEQALASGIQCPLSSSVGRLFDAVAALCDLCFERNTYEGQAAMALEALLNSETVQANQAQGYPVSINAESDIWQLQSQPLFQAILDDLQQGVSVAVVATRFHIGLAQGLVRMAMQLQKRYVFNQLAFSGGVCQNGWLMTLIMQQLPPEIGVYCHQNLPANDQSIAVGQVCLPKQKGLVKDSES